MAGGVQGQGPGGPGLLLPVWLTPSSRWPCQDTGDVTVGL